MSFSNKETKQAATYAYASSAFPIWFPLQKYIKFLKRNKYQRKKYKPLVFPFFPFSLSLLI